MLTIDKTRPVMGVPPAFTERCAVRILGKKFGISQKEKPMITISDIELVGYFDADNELQTTIEKGGVVCNLNGINLKPAYFPLTQESVKYYAAFYRGATGVDFESIDETNPDLSYMDGLVMQALVKGNMVPILRSLTDEEKAEKLAKGEKAIGDPIKDDEGNIMQRPEIQVSMWLKAYTHPVPDSPQAGK